MGIFSRLFYDRFITPGKMGYFQVDYFNDPSLLMTDHEKKQADFPLVVENGRIVSGYMELTPVTQQKNYRASILVEG